MCRQGEPGEGALWQSGLWNREINEYFSGGSVRERWDLPPLQSFAALLRFSCHCRTLMQELSIGMGRRVISQVGIKISMPCEATVKQRGSYKPFTGG